ncbi:hypothetical protein CSDY_1391, partial [Streptococcus dysgalactiae]
QLNLKQ